MANNNTAPATKVIVPCRISFANIWEARSINGSEEKYSVSLLIPKDDKATLAKIKKAIEAAKEAAKEKKSQLDGKKFELKVKTGEGGKLYGAVTAMDVAQILKDNGFDIDKKNITLKSQIKSVGTFEAKVKLHTEVSCEIQVEVVPNN